MKKQLQKIGDWFKRYSTILKAIFVLSVLVYAIVELGHITHDLNGQAVRQSFAQQSPWTLLSLLLLGFLAVTPMLNYDFVFTELLPGEYSKIYIAKSGWIVNTFTNIAGFGGFLGASLRANFYSKKASQKQVILAISKIALFLLAGLSIWCFVALVMIFGFHLSGHLEHYWFWLAGGAAYFPLLFLITHQQQSGFFADLPWSRELRLILGSMTEWGFAGGFFLLIGAFLHISTDIWAVFPLFMIANVIGVVSMVPGGIGSFDVMMLVGLGALGVNNNLAVVWLLFYRLFYYIFPFIVGLIFFAQDTGKRLNHFLEGLPLQILQKLAHRFLVAFLYFSAIMLLIIATVPDLALRNVVFRHLYPFTFIFLDRVSNILVAFLLLGFARGIANKVRKAFWPTLLILGVAMINTLYRDWSFKFFCFLVIVFLALVLTKGALTRDKLTLSWSDRLKDHSIFALAFIFYALAGFYSTPRIHHRHPIPSAFLFPSERLWVMSFLAVLVAAATVFLINRYLSNGGTKLDDGFDAERIHQLIVKFGGNEVSHLAYLRDKALHFYQVEGQDQVFFLYRRKADRLIIMGEPVGNRDYFSDAIQDFLTKADQQDCSLVFYEISGELTMSLHEMGFDFFKVGEEGYVDLNAFNLRGNKRKAQRALLNKFKREGYTFEMRQPPFSEADFIEFQKISDSWLNGRTEKGFSLGFFDRYYLNRAPIAVIRAQNGELIAFANVMPTGDHQVTSVDLMRHLKTAPSGIMDEVFINLFYENQAAGYQYFNLGMAPLANVGESQFSFLEERLAHLIYRYGYRFYGFQGLRSYKDKYVTKWVPKFIAYRKRSSIVFTVLQIMLVVNRPQNKDTKNDNSLTRHFGRLSKLDR